MAKVIAVDFDGTLCERNFPDIGAPIMSVIEYVTGVIWTTDTLYTKAKNTCKSVWRKSEGYAPSWVLR